MKRLTLVTCFLALVVIGLGAYTRLKDAGLGCPDWPGCYGQLVVPSSENKLNQAKDTYHQMVEPDKAWLEMIHRYVAGSLGLFILVLAIKSLTKKSTTHQASYLPWVIVGMVVFQALLGMWTVTLRLSPPIILLHLYGGLTILALLWWQYLSYTPLSFFSTTPKNVLSKWVILGLAILFVQIGLGALTSANYAALICPDFPYCQGVWFPQFNFQGFLSSTIVHANDLLVTLHMTHRLGAVATALFLMTLAVKVYCRTSNTILRKIAMILFALVLTQVILGILNIRLLLPTSTAVAHNLTAALLVLTLVTMLFYSPLYQTARRYP